jgi:chromosome partitioning protein
MLSSEQRHALRRVIAVANDKGGVGKTSIATNLSGLLAAAGFRVLLVDLDDQANTGEDLGYTYSNDGDDGQGAMQAITTGSPLDPIKNIRERLDVVPAGHFTTDLAHVLDGRRQRQGGATAVIDALAISLAPIAERYDVVFIDCPPKVRAMQEMALGAARWLLSPTKSDASSRKAIGQIADRFVAAREHNETLDLLGVVIFGSGASAKRLREETTREIAADLGAGEMVFTAYIRHAEAPAAQARNTGRLVHELEEHAANQVPWYQRLRNAATQESNVSDTPVAASVKNLAGDYQALAEQLISRLEAAEQAAAEEATK